MTFLVAFSVLSCHSAPVAQPSREPPPPPAPILAVTDGRLSLQANAYLELHEWLTASAKIDAEVEPELEMARGVYRRFLGGQDDDEAIDGVARSLADCSDDRCAIAAVAPFPFARAYEHAIPAFMDKAWSSRASTAWVGISASHAVLGQETEVLLPRAAKEVGLTWPEKPVRIDVVAETPALSRTSLMPNALGARGTCFFGRGVSGELQRVDEARILDCLFVHALLGAHPSSPLRATLIDQLGAREGKRAWTLLVIHAVAAVLTSWEPRHFSVYRRSAHATEGPVLDWLAREWHGGGDPSFIERFATEWRKGRPEGKPT